MGLSEVELLEFILSESDNNEELLQQLIDISTKNQEYLMVSMFILVTVLIVSVAKFFFRESEIK